MLASLLVLASLLCATAAANTDVEYMGVPKSEPSGKDYVAPPDPLYVKGRCTEPKQGLVNLSEQHGLRTLFQTVVPDLQFASAAEVCTGTEFEAWPDATAVLQYHFLAPTSLRGALHATASFRANVSSLAYLTRSSQCALARERTQAPSAARHNRRLEHTG